MGFEMETVEALASTLQFQHHGGRLWVSEELQGTLDLVDLVTAALLSTWFIVKFSGSRWLTIGTSSRSLVVALLIGFEDLCAAYSRGHCCQPLLVECLLEVDTKSESRLG